MRVLFNGYASRQPPVDDRGLAFGDGLFETLLVRKGRPVWLDEHLQRLQAGCQRLAIDCPLPLLRHDIDRQLAEAPASAVLKIIVTRRSGGARGYRPATTASDLLLLTGNSGAPA
jgi:4-amino-4-deoxychorismate lyase